MTNLLTLSDRVIQLEQEHGSLRAAARKLGLDPGYLHKLKCGKKYTPSPATLGLLGLTRVITYVRQENSND